MGEDRGQLPPGRAGNAGSENVRRALLIGAAVALIAGVGGGYWWYSIRGTSAPEQISSAPATPAPAAAAPEAPVSEPQPEPKADESASAASAASTPAAPQPTTAESSPTQSSSSGAPAPTPRPPQKKRQPALPPPVATAPPPPAPTPAPEPPKPSPAPAPAPVAVVDPCASLKGLKREQCKACGNVSGVGKFVCEQKVHITYCFDKTGTTPDCPRQQTDPYGGG